MNRRIAAASVAAFALFLLIGLCAFDDYGLAWDDGTSRGATGLVNWNFITRGVSKTLLEGNEKYHGPAYELFLVGLEKILFLKDIRVVFLMRHLTMFLTFFLAVIAFFQIAKRVLGGSGYALCASVMLVLSPRIFADSFINSKDLVFLSFSIFATWTLFRALDKPSLLGLAIHALACGILVDIRILGILHVAVSALCLVAQGARERREKFIAQALKLVFYAGSSAGFIVLFWPVLWLDPWHHFRAALDEMSRYHWEGMVLYAGERLRSTELPWHYLPTWIWISTPLLYSVLFVVGSASGAVAAIKLVPAPSRLLGALDLRWLAIGAFCFAPVLSVIALHSVVYDGWRHVFCVYPFFILIAAQGIRAILALLPEAAISAWSMFGLVAIQAALVAIDMWIMHPHENVYFNELARRTWRPMVSSFEQDYWGLSFRQGLERVLELEPYPKAVRVAASNYACKMNFSILEARDRDRLTFVDDRRECDYFLTNFRRAEDGPVEEIRSVAPVHTIYVDESPILSVYRTQP